MCVEQPTTANKISSFKDMGFSIAIKSIKNINSVKFCVIPDYDYKKDDYKLHYYKDDYDW